MDFFLQKPAAVSAAFDMAFHAFGMIVCLRGQARIESYEQMLELIDLAEEDSSFD